MWIGPFSSGPGPGCYSVPLLTQPLPNSTSSLVGQLYHLCKCACVVRAFISRLQDFKCLVKQAEPCFIGHGVHRDLTWLSKFTDTFNGVHVLETARDSVFIYVDACIMGAGGLCNNIAYNLVYSPWFTLFDAGLSTVNTPHSFCRGGAVFYFRAGVRCYSDVPLQPAPLGYSFCGRLPQPQQTVTSRITYTPPSRERL